MQNVLLHFIEIRSCHRALLKVLYSCNEKKEPNQKQVALVKKDCQNQETCQINASREFFGNSQCPGTDDAEMLLWLIYSCDGGGSDKTTFRSPKCDNGTTPSPGLFVCLFVCLFFYYPKHI